MTRFHAIGRHKRGIFTIR